MNRNTYKITGFDGQSFSVPERFAIKITQDLPLLVREFPDIEEIVLYGSCAKENTRYNSDIDIAVVFDTVSSEVRRKVLSFLSDRSTTDNPDFDANIVSSEWYKNADTVYAKAVKRGIVLYKKRGGKEIS